MIRQFSINITKTMPLSSKIKQTFTTAFFLSLISISCTGSFRSNSTSIPATTANATQDAAFPIFYGEIIEPENSEHIIIPVGYYSNYGKSRGISEYSRSSGDTSYLVPYNMIFHHKTTGATHLLLSKNSIINAYNFVALNNKQGKPENKFIFFQVIDQDTNGDGKKNALDAMVGYLADMSGKNVTQITPNNTNLGSWHLDSKQGFMLVKITADTNSDQIFNEADDMGFIRVNLNQPKIGVDIITPTMRQQLNQKISPIPKP